MVRKANPSDAERKGHPVIVPQKNGVPDRTSLSSIGKNTDEILIDIYVNQYLIEGWDFGNSGDYLVYSAELSCTNRSGSSGAFLHLEETIEYDRRKIGHGALINGLPQANKFDAKAGVNIDSFGGCKLLIYEDAKERSSIISAANAAGCDVCAYIRNLNDCWITPSESGLMEVGGAKAITTNSFLLCFPTKIQEYANKGIQGGKIKAVDNGQSHLDDLLKDYRTQYIADIGNAAATPLFNAFRMQFVYEFVYLYEVRYPERERAMVNFFRCVEDNTLLEDILKIKCMTYMLEERVVRRMTELMGEKGGIFIKMFQDKNPDPDGADAFFTDTFFEGPKIMYYNVSNARNNHKPPYKTFFHEFGHAIDSISQKGSGYYSDDFHYQQGANRKRLMYDSNIGDYHIEIIMESKDLTIHEWGEYDLENCLVQVAFELLKGTIHKGTINSNVKLGSQLYLASSITPLMQYKIAIFAIYNRILCWDGASKIMGMPNSIEINDLYLDICNVIKDEILKTVHGGPPLPLDLFGGLTNNQAGSGHPDTYWFNNKGKRVRTISKEAFAGYFEYRVTIFDPNIQNDLINPKLPNTGTCFNYTKLAMEAMFNNVV